VSGDPRERQWHHQRLSLAVVRGNAASILACVQVSSNFTCSFSCCFQRTDHHHCLTITTITAQLKYNITEMQMCIKISQERLDFNVPSELRGRAAAKIPLRSCSIACKQCAVGNNAQLQ